MHPNFVGALLNSALYLVAVFVAALLTANPLAWKLAIAAMGVTYLSHVVFVTAAAAGPSKLWALGNGLVWLSIALGLLAGLALLF